MASQYFRPFHVVSKKAQTSGSTRVDFRLSVSKSESFSIVFFSSFSTPGKIPASSSTMREPFHLTENDGMTSSPMPVLYTDLSTLTKTFVSPYSILAEPEMTVCCRVPQKSGVSEEAHSSHQGEHLRPVRDEGAVLHSSRDLHVSHRFGVQGPSEDVPLSRQLLHHW